MAIIREYFMHIIYGDVCMCNSIFNRSPLTSLRIMLSNNSSILFLLSVYFFYTFSFVHVLLCFSRVQDRLDGKFCYL